MLNIFVLESSSIVRLLLRKMTARSSYGGRYIRLHGNWGEKTLCIDGLFFLAACRKITVP